MKKPLRTIAVMYFVATLVHLVAKKIKSYTDSLDVASFYKEFEGRSQYSCGRPRWEEVAAYVYNWIETNPLKISI